jgi:hypothetical protein
MKALEEIRMDKMMEMEKYGLLGSTDKGSYAPDNSFQENEQLYPDMQYDGGSGGDSNKSNYNNSLYYRIKIRTKHRKPRSRAKTL